MKRLLVLMLFLSSVGVMGATPSSPTTLTDGQVLTAAYLNSAFSTIYSWAQATNASVTTLMSGVTSGNTVTASFTASAASNSSPLVWDSTALEYVAMTASGTLFFDAAIVAIASGGADAAAFRIQGALQRNATGTFMIGSTVTNSWFTNDAWAIVASYSHPGRLHFLASTTANVIWKAKLDTKEVDY